MALCTVNVANLTPHARREVVTTVVSLPQGSVRPDSRLAFVAKDPLGDAVDRDCEWYPFGNYYPDGSCRRARIVFPVEVAAGVLRASRSDSKPYPYYTNKAVSIDIARREPSIPTWTQHGSVTLSSVSGTFTYHCTATGTGASAGRSASFTLASGRVRQQDGTLTTTVTEDDTGWATRFPSCGRWVRSWIVPVRILPELDGGLLRDATMYGRMIFELPTSAVTGLGQIARFWWEWGNSLTTSDDETDPTKPARDPGTTGYELHARPTLALSGASVTVEMSDALLRIDPTTSGGTTTIELIDHLQPVRDQTLFNWGTMRCVTGTLAIGSLSGTAATTWQGMRWCEIGSRTNSGDQAWMDAIADNWGAHRNFMAYGILPKRSWGHWPTDAAMEDAAAKCAHDDRHDYSTRAAWRKSVHGSDPRPGVPSNQPGFGNIGLYWLAMAALPDFRAARVSAFFEGSHTISHREIDGTPFDPFDYPSTSVPTAQTGVVMWMYGMPKLPVGGTGAPNGFQGLGKHTALVANPNSWTGYAPSHCTMNSAQAYVLLTGDRGARLGIGKDIVNMAMCSAFDISLEGMMPAYNTTDSAFYSARAPGRTARFKMHAVCFSDDHDRSTAIVQTEINRFAAVYDYCRAAGSRPSWWDHGEVGDMDAEMATTTVDRPGYFVGTRLVTTTTWLQGMMIGGMHAVYLMAQNYDASTISGYVEKVEKLRQSLATQSKAHFLYLWRKVAAARASGGTDGQWWGYYAIQYQWDPNQRGRALPEQYWTYPQTAPNGSLYFKSPDSGVPNLWGGQGTMLAPVYNPGDHDIAAEWEKIDGLTSACIFPIDPAWRDQNARYGFGKLGEPWMGFYAVIDDPFTAYSGGPGGVTLTRSGTASIVLTTTGTAEDPWPGIHRRTGTASLALTTEADPTIPPVRLTRSGTASLALTTSATWTGSVTTHLRSGTAEIVLLCESEIGSVITITRSGTASLELTTEDNGGAIAHFRTGTASLALSTDIGEPLLWWSGSGTAELALTTEAEGVVDNPLGRERSNRQTRRVKGVDPITSEITLVRAGGRIIRVPGRWFR